ncbi:hypothetical protein B0H10DRAFT_1975910 [Mycena sp. CBHHK59/15]|nr:hypothetical protein B0H10DRAFT_1975910 [Mycena sp. CBHHK59/15]
MGFENFRVGHAGAAWSHGRNKRADDTSAADPSCAMGAFYTAPTLGSSYDALNPLAITWQPSLACLQPAPTLVDIYLYAPGTASSRLHLWQNVPYAPGNYSATLLPRWWNATSSASLQLNVVAAGTAPFLRTIPAGPVFTATYTAPSSGTPASADTALSSGDSGITAVTAPSSAISSRHLSRGKTAAAVLLPLLFCLLLGLAYLKISRARGAAKRSAWSEKLDKRMSTISVDWKSITPGGAKEAVRQSIAHGPSMDERRSQAFSFGAIRPSSTVAVEEYNEKEPEPRTSLGSGVGVGVGARRPRTHASPPERGSRAVSFADAAPSRTRRRRRCPRCRRRAG